MTHKHRLELVSPPDHEPAEFFAPLSPGFGLAFFPFRAIMGKSTCAMTGTVRTRRAEASRGLVQARRQAVCADHPRARRFDAATRRRAVRALPIQSRRRRIPARAGSKRCQLGWYRGSSSVPEVISGAFLFFPWHRACRCGAQKPRMSLARCAERRDSPCTTRCLQTCGLWSASAK